jgi:hypothetical protein
MKPYGEKNGGVDSKRQIQDQLGNDTYITPSAIGPEENLTVRICDLEPYIQQEEKEIRRTEETARSSNRRRKIRIFFPSLPL